MERTSTRILITIAVSGIVAVDVLHSAIIRGQGEGPPDVFTAPFVAGYLGLMAALLGSSLFLPPPTRTVVRSAASTGLVALGLLALFSIGILILAMAGLAIATTVQALAASGSARVLGASALASIVALALLVGGFELAWTHLVCPSTGESSGTTASFFVQQSYSCSHGRLTTTR